MNFLLKLTSFILQLFCPRLWEFFYCCWLACWSRVPWRVLYVKWPMPRRKLRKEISILICREFEAVTKSEASQWLFKK